MPAEKPELTIARLINAPPALVWKAWSTPEHVAKWWIPAPIECKVIKLDLRPGGGLRLECARATANFSRMSKAVFWKSFLKPAWCSRRS